ncbi:MAG: DUF374 domain-containing protein [Erysipelotrichia bacterium]|nr:DUF374 domain-containing protein [Erysipelotrichia bacterium]
MSSRITMNADLASIKGLISFNESRWKNPAYVAKLRLKSMLLAATIMSVQALTRVETVGFNDFINGKNLGRPILIVSWHGTMIVPLYCHRDLNIVIMNSLSEDGDLMVKVLNYFGYNSVRGSSSRGGMRALLEMVKRVKDGMPASLTVDGPRGPRHEVKPGMVMLAQKTGALVLPVGVAFSNCLTLNSWDKTQIPLPGSRAVMHTGEPFEIDSNTSIEDGCALIKQHLNDSNRQAENYLKTGKLSGKEC